MVYLCIPKLLSGENPVLVIDQQVLESEVQWLGESVSSFFASVEYRSNVPEGVEVMTRLE